ASMAEPAAAQRVTGYVVGAVSPFGQRASLPTVVDSGALVWDRQRPKPTAKPPRQHNTTARTAYTSPSWTSRAA
ncbi:MAG: hypothetical protein WB785_13010, partial [Mycobacterium sp.]